MTVRIPNPKTRLLSVLLFYGKIKSLQKSAIPFNMFVANVPQLFLDAIEKDYEGFQNPQVSPVARVATVLSNLISTKASIQF